MVTATVSAREFIRVWQTSSSVAEVAAKVRRKKNAVRVRAYRYRQMGVPLKEFPEVVIELPDWDELAEYAGSLVPKTAAISSPAPADFTAANSPTASGPVDGPVAADAPGC